MRNSTASRASAGSREAVEASPRARRTLSATCSSSPDLPTSWSSSASTSSSGRSSSCSSDAKRSRSRVGVPAASAWQPLERPDRQQRVLVDRVLVVEVADHAAGDRPELRAASGRAGRCRASPTAARRARRAASGTASNARLPRRRREGNPRPRSGRRAAESRQRVVRDGGAGVDRRLERREPGLGLARPRTAASTKRTPSRRPHQVRADRHRRDARASIRATASTPRAWRK